MAGLTIAAAICVCIGGCLGVFSLHPLFDDEHTVFEPQLVGTWVDNSSSWEFAKATEKSYTLNLTFEDTGKKASGQFDVVLVKLDGKLYMDMTPSDSVDLLEIMSSDPNTRPYANNLFLMMPVHAFAAIDVNSTNLNIKLTDPDKFQKIITEDPNAIEIEVIEKTFPVITAKTPKLQEFVKKYANDPRLFCNEGNLTRNTGSVDPNMTPQ